MSATIAFGIILVVMHLLEPSFDTSPVSLFSLGQFGTVMRVGFVLLGLAFFSLLMGFWSEARDTASYYADLILFFVSGLGLVMIGFFNTDPIGSTVPTFGGIVHSYAALAWSLSCSLGILIFAVAFRLNGKSLQIGYRSRNLAVIILADWFLGFFGQFAVVSALQPRIFYSLVVVWVLMVANQFRTGGLKVEPPSQ